MRFVMHRAHIRALPPSLRSVSAYCRFAVFVPASRLCEGQKQPNPADRGFQMLLARKSKAQTTQELIRRSIDSLIQALEAGHSDVYLLPSRPWESFTPILLETFS
jgi:hypothetical protein